VETVLTVLDLIFNRRANEGGAFTGEGAKLVGSQWVLPDTSAKDSKGRPLTILSLINVTSFVQAPMYGFAFGGSLGVAQAGTVWNLIDGFANRLVNEFFFDVRDYVREEEIVLRHLEDTVTPRLRKEDVTRQRKKRQKVADSGVFNQSTLNQDFSTITTAPDSPPTPVPALVHRQMPYDTDAFRLLQTHDLHYTETFEYDVVYDTHSIFNFFRINFPDVPEIQQEKIFGLLINLNSLVKFGIRRLEGETRFCFSSGNDAADHISGKTRDPPFRDAFEYYNELLATWHAANEQMLTGNITCRFRPEIRVGTRLRFTRTDETVFFFYIQAVNHSFSTQQGQSRTSLSLIRGVPDPWAGKTVAGLLVNNLRWNSQGMNIPPGLVPYVATSSIKGDGMEWRALTVEKKQNPVAASFIPEILKP
jgi:hypothetical protein